MGLPEKLGERGIRLRHYGPGNQYALCPECSASRKPHNRKKPCLSVAIGPTALRSGGNVEEGHVVWHCHNCGWTGGIGDRTTGDHAGYRSRFEGKGVGRSNGFSQRDENPRRKRWW